MSKNNIKELLNKMRPQRPHYGIRKLSIGVASVLLSITIFAGEGAVAHADSQNNVNNTVQTGNTSSNSENTNKVVLSNDKKSASDAASPAGSQGSSANTGVNSATSAGNASEAQPAAKPAQPATAPANDKGASKPSAPDSSSDTELAKEAKIFPQTTVQGEVPDLDLAALVNHAYQQLHNLNLHDATKVPGSDEPVNDMSVEWVHRPDVSKLGKATGTAQLKYVDTDGKKQTLTLPIEVDVLPGQKKAADEARNTLNIVEKDSNRVIYRYSWTG